MFDPVRDKSIPLAHEQQVLSYWSAIQPDYQHERHALPRQCDVLIVGAGYTGLNAAITLAQDFQQHSVVIDAGAIGAGCSSRNAGFVLPGTGRLSFQDYQRQFGNDVARAVQNEFAKSVEHVKDQCKNAPTSLHLSSTRYLKLAHKRNLSKKLEQQVSLYQDTLLQAEWLSPNEINAQLPGVKHAYGGIAFTPAMSLNPKAYVNQLARTCDQLGVHLHSQIVMLRYEQGLHDMVVHTNQGIIHARKLLLCTNGYMPFTVAPTLTRKHLPVLSSVLVTEPLSAAQIEQVGFSQHDLIMDTRKLKYYYRLLPDNRLLFGGRGAITGNKAENPKYTEHLLAALKQSLPALQDLNAAFRWQGWISVSLDSMPRVFEHERNVHAAMGYCGAGIAFSSLAGKRIAEQAMEKNLPPLPFYQGSLPNFPLPAFRRLGQWGYYQYGRWVD
ncbi:MAG: Glycine/D-amino acid oxidases (deaminating) [Idiomarinaceae bacterium HL-53]|nr:MAG: Glycine/D-amino acid oxidases (deaminating) [Idiomarinaceae bacterium HL-53]CUS47310.1 Glycine/D-amino acid oxidase (deaminating) [Idiomarinaceae bacterium HL-53]